MVICDLIGVKDSLLKDVRQQVSRAYRVPPRNILVGGTHTHSGPATSGLIGWGEEDTGYLTELPQRILPAVGEALRNLEEVDVGMAHIPFPAEEMSFNRVRTEKGVDQSLGLIKLTGKKSRRPVAFLVNYGTHAVVQGPVNTLISRDWPGVATDLIGRELKAETIFLQGACGDINSKPCVCKSPEEGFHEMERIGELFARCAVAGLQDLEVGKADVFSSHSFFAGLPLIPIPEDELQRLIQENEDVLRKTNTSGEAKSEAQFQIAGAKAQLGFYSSAAAAPIKKVEVQLIRIGKGIVATVPGELFSEFARMLEESLPKREVFVVTHTNGSVGYIPSVYDFEIKSYASTYSPRMCGNMPFRRDVGERLVEQILNHAKSLGG